MHKRINYVFLVEYRVRAGAIVWAARPDSRYEIPNNTPRSVHELAASLILRCCTPDERGVRVTFLGIRDPQWANNLPTKCLPFTLTFDRQ